jgi:hypothetical protein
MAYGDDPTEPEATAYAVAIELLSKGVQPFCVLIDDDLHVVACKPTNRVSLAQMINIDGKIRDGYMVSCMKLVRDAIEEEALT